MKISGDDPDMLITYALGSCLGITVYDFKLKRAGLVALHVAGFQY